jgi:hypothetical protein
VLRIGQRHHLTFTRLAHQQYASERKRQHARSFEITREHVDTGILQAASAVSGQTDKGWRVKEAEQERGKKRQNCKLEKRSSHVDDLRSPECFPRPIHEVFISIPAKITGASMAMISPSTP